MAIAGKSKTASKTVSGVAVHQFIAESMTQRCVQQASVLREHTGLETGGYVGSMGVDFWKEKDWKVQLAKQQVMVMTHQILLNSLRHGFIKVKLPVCCISPSQKDESDRNETWKHSEICSCL